VQNKHRASKIIDTFATYHHTEYEEDENDFHHVRSDHHLRMASDPYHQKE
jgi:hypothetical protein